MYPASKAEAGEATATPSGAPAVAVHNVSKSFDGVPALEDVDLELRRGEVHVLLGENGAGKTTLSNVLAGIYRADEGTIEVDGVERQFHSPADAIAAGIGMVHQHFKLVDTMTVAENIHLGWTETPRHIRRKDLVIRTRDVDGRVRAARRHRRRRSGSCRWASNSVSRSCACCPGVRGSSSSTSPPPC